MTTAIGYILDHQARLSETFIREELRELRRRGHRIEVLALRPGDVMPRHDEPSMLLAEDFPSARGKPAVALRHASAFARPGRVSTIGRMKKLFPDEDVPWFRLPLIADELSRRGVVHLHAHFAWRGAAVAAGLAPLMGVPWSMTLHARDIFADKRNLDAKLALVDRLITVCEYNRDWLEEHHGPLPPTWIAVCGVRVPKKASGQDPRTDVVAVARLVEKKGLDLLVEAAGALVSTIPELSIDIVGDGPERTRLQASIDELNLSHRVRLLGSLPHAETLDRIARARLVCLPSRIAKDGDRDSMPVVLKEAMARGVPVVATDLVGIPEMVDDLVGRLVPPNDVPALASAIAELLGDDELRRRLGGTGRARVMERFTIRHQVDVIERVCRPGAIGVGEGDRRVPRGSVVRTLDD